MNVHLPMVTLRICMNQRWLLDAYEFIFSLVATHSDVLRTWRGLRKALIFKSPLPDSNFIGLNLPRFILMLLRCVTMVLRNLSWKHRMRVLNALLIDNTSLIVISNWWSWHALTAWSSTHDLLTSIQSRKGLLAKLLVDLRRDEGGSCLHTSTIINECGWWRGCGVQAL